MLLFCPALVARQSSFKEFVYSYIRVHEDVHECNINQKKNNRKSNNKTAVAYPGILFGEYQQFQLRTERTGIWGR